MQEIDHADRFVHHDDGRGAQTQTTVFAGSIEVERAVELVRRQQAHADPAGNGGFAAAPLPDAAAEVLDQLMAR